MRDFWRNSGFHLLERDRHGRLQVTDDFLRAYYLRPEVHPVEESCEAENSLHAALMDHPRRDVGEHELAAIADADAQDNYRVVLRFRARLLQAASVESCYAALFQGPVDVPPLLISQLAHVILRSMLDGCEDSLRLRAAEIFFREQKATIQDGHVLLADLETVEMHAAGSRYGNLGRLIVEAQGSIGEIRLDVLDRANSELYWNRESRFDTVIAMTHGKPALDEYARLIEQWVALFASVEVLVVPIRAIETPHWSWHIGLDAESTAILNELWSGAEIEHGRMQHMLALFRMEFAQPAVMRKDIAGDPVYLALSCDGDGVVRMKPQNLLLNLPLARQV